MSDTFRGEIRTSYMDSTPWWDDVKRPPKGAPNVLYILLDDTGYSQIGCYGSSVATPNIDSIAADGLRYSDFHVNAMCSPTRASLLTGCNNHTVGFSYLGNNDPIEWLEKVKTRLVHVHAKDISFSQSDAERGKVMGTAVGCACGDGVIDWEKVAAILKPLPQDIVLSVECGSLDQAARSIDHLRKVLGK